MLIQQVFRDPLAYIIRHATPTCLSFRCVMVLILFFAVAANAQEHRREKKGRITKEATSTVQLLQNAAIHTLNGEHAEAERCYREALSSIRGHNPSSLKASLLLANAIEKQEDRQDEAASLLMKALATHRKPLGEDHELVQQLKTKLMPMLDNLAWTNSIAAESTPADLEAAVKFAEQGAKLQPRIRRHWLVALAKLKQGDKQGSLDAMNRSIAAGNEDWIGAWFIMAMIQAKHDNRQAALDWYQAAQDRMVAANSTFAPNAIMRDHATKLLGIEPDWPPKDWSNEKCLKCFDRLIKTHPQVLRLRIGRIDVARRAEKRDVARRDMQEVVEMLTAEIKKDPDQPTLRSQRGDVLARLGQWKKAVEDLEAAIDPEATASMPWLQASPAVVMTGDRTQYRKFCKRMMKKFGESEQPTDVERIVKVALLLPGEVDTAELPIDKLERHLKGEGVEQWELGWGWTTLGLAEVRRGNPQDALACIEKAAEFDDFKNSQPQQGLGMMIKTLAFQQLKQAKEAKQAYDDGVALIQAEMAGTTEHNSLIAEILRREAEQGLEETTVADADEGEESVLDAFIQANAGRWVCESVADQDIEGYMTKGETIRMETVRTPMPGNLGLNDTWHLEKDGEIRGRSNGIAIWDPTTESIRTYGTATGGYRVESVVKKVDGQWIDETKITYPDGSLATSKGIVTVSEEGNVHSVLITDRVDNEGNELPDTTDVWKRVTKGSEVLQDELTWLIGEWADEEKGLGLTCKWAAERNVIEFHWSNPLHHGVSIILWDAGEQKVKMWGAGSDGGSGQATMRPDGDGVVCTNVGIAADGKQTAVEFTMAPAGDSELIMGWVDVDTGEDKKITLQKKS